MSYELNTERQHLFAPNIKVIEKVDFIGVNNVDILIDAIQYACNSHEILNSYIKISHDGTASYEKMEKEQFVEVSSKEWEVIAESSLSQRFEIEKGELIKFYIIPKGKHLELLIIAHHLAGDGLSIVYLIEDIAKAVNGEKLPYRPIKILQTKDFPKNTELSLFSKFITQKINKKWLMQKKVFDFSDARKIHDAYWNKYDSVMLVHQFTEEETKAIVDVAKCSGVTVNSLLTAVIADKYNENAEIGMAVSVRGDYRGMSNMASGIAMQYREKKCLSESTKYLHKSIYKKLSSDYHKYIVLRFMDMLDGSFLDSVFTHLYAEPQNKETQMLCKIMRYGENKRSIGISNLSKLDIRVDYGDVSIDNFVFIPPLTPYAKRVFGIAGLDGKMVLTVHLMDDDEVEGEVMHFRGIVYELSLIE